MKRLAAICGCLCLHLALSAGPAQADFSEFEIESAGASLSTYQAGAHADFTTFFKVKAELADGESAQTRDVAVSLPPGLVGDPTNAPRCSMAQFVSGSCSIDAQVGITEFVLKGSSVVSRQPVYNLTPPTGDSDIVARFGFPAEFFPVIINVRVRSASDYGVTATAEASPAAVALRSVRTTIWGVPASPVHDSERLEPTDPPGSTVSHPSSLPPKPFLSNPTRCGVPLKVTIAADTYQLPGDFSSREMTLPAMTGCSKLSFHPTFRATPTSREAAAPTGLDVAIEIPQDETPQGLATPQIKDSRVALPPGMTLAAGAADGLVSCDPIQAGYKSAGPGRCPSASKIGSVELDAPALDHPLRGFLYQRTPEPGHLFRVWIVADELGVHVALPGEIEADPGTGQITAAFLETPQVPIRAVRLHVFGGPRGPLANPSRCGTYRTSWELVPWSGTPAAAGEAAMSIDAGCHTGDFAPRLSAGTTDPRAGAFAPFVFDLTRDTGEQNIEGLEVTLPQGLLAKLKGVPLCPEAVAPAASCPPASRIGSVAVASGPGTNPLWIPQPGKDPTAIFLAGPYKGAPYSMIVRIPAQAGPFDLGTVAVRSALRIDPETARVTVVSDPLPQILEGVPISYRRIHAQIDRAAFTLNPTSCAPKKIGAQLVAPSGAVADAQASYRATECSRLRYRPKLSLRLIGGTRRTQHPALAAVLLQRPGEANNARATVVLPQAEFLDQSHLNNPCTRVQFNANKCPAGSILGTATAISPLLDRPLRGKVYFRSNGGDRELPDIVVDLKGPIHITLVGFIDAVEGNRPGTSRIRTTFAHLPDAPVTKFSMHLFGGDRGLLQNSENLCAGGSESAYTELRGQNGKVRKSGSSLRISCPNRATPPARR